MIPPIETTQLAHLSKSHSHQSAKEVAIQFEASFLAEMLKSAGLHSSPSLFGGGSGEDQFSSFLIQEQAIQIARAGGVGLAEAIFTAIKDDANEF